MAKSSTYLAKLQIVRKLLAFIRSDGMGIIFFTFEIFAEGLQLFFFVYNRAEYVRGTRIRWLKNKTMDNASEIIGWLSSLKKQMEQEEDEF